MAILLYTLFWRMICFTLLDLIFYIVVFFWWTKDAIVLCRVFQKSGSGPKNGEQYGAPFIEEEWEDDELELVPKQEAAEEVDFGDDFYLDGHDLEQVNALTIILCCVLILQCFGLIRAQ